MSKQLEHYAKTALPDRYTIFGVTLRPLSLGHLILMKRLNCACGADESKRSANLWDLLIAVAICCRKYDDFIEWYYDDQRRDKWLVKWYESIIKQSKDKNWSLLNKFSLFNMYKRESVIIPIYVDGESQNDGRESGAHWIQNVIHTLTTKGRYTEKEVLDLAVSKALADYFKILETEGVISFMKDWELDAIEKANNGNIRNTCKS